MTNKNAPIGVFDSGVGGLTVMKEIMHQIPNEKIIYFGDTARVPYGNKSKDTVLRFSRQIVRFLKTQEVKAIVIACNTASAYALPDIEKEIDIPIIGVVRPGAKVAAQVTQIAVSRSKAAGSLHLMMANNPVFLIVRNDQQSHLRRLHKENQCTGDRDRKGLSVICTACRGRSVGGSGHG